MCSQRRHNQAQKGQTDETNAVAVDLPEEKAVPILREGEFISSQRIAWGSNYTFLVRLDAGPGRYLRAVYKPRDGERPLYDFPQGTLYKREYAAYLLTLILGWPDAPTTLIREGPYGVGSIQLYVESDPEATYFNLVDSRTEELLRFAVFDVLANNADRKAGHCLLGNDGRLWSIDHGLTFHSIFKLRTVMLEYWGTPLPQSLQDSLTALANGIESGSGRIPELMELLSEREVGALSRRLETLLKDPRVPELDPWRNVPWPPV